MRRGPKPTPTAVRVAKGNPSKRALPVGEPAPPAAAEDVPPPAHLSAEEKVEWRRLAPMLVRASVLSELDLDALQQLCEVTVLLRAARTAARGKPRRVKVYGQWQLHHLHQDTKDLRDEQRRLLAEFGMSPAQRSRVTKVSAPTKGNKFSVLRGGKAGTA